MITCERHMLSPELDTELAELTGSSLLCSPGFLQLFTCLAGQPVWWLAIEKNKPVAAIAGVEFGGRLIRRFQSLPDGLYSRLCIAPGARPNADTVGHHLIEAIAEYPYAKAFIYDYHFDYPSLPQWQHRDLATQHVEIPSPEWMPPDRQLRGEIRKAKREDIQVVPFDATTHLDGFIHLVNTTSRRNRTSPRYPRRFFDALAALAERDERVVWRWCEHEGQPVASHIYLVESPMALNWQVFSDRQFSSLKANQYMLHHTATQLSDRGVSVLNLGGSPANVESVVSFKKKWGSERYRYPMYYRRRGLGRWL